MLLRLGAPGAASSRLPLDGLEGVAAAYGTRKLSASYTGPCLRLRRSSDNAEADFGFAWRVVDAAAISAWLNGATGYVAKWYDQSGNGRHAVQATAANQPVIEPLNTVNGCLGVTCDGVNQTPFAAKYLTIPTGVSLSRRNFSAFCVLNPLVSLQNNMHFEFGSGATITNLFTDRANGGIGLHNYDNVITRVLPTLVPPAQPFVEALVGDAASLTAYVNGVSASTTAPGNATMVGGRLGHTTIITGYEGRNDYFAFIALAAAISPAAAASLSAALRTSFGIVAAETAQLVLDGDSITEGFGATRLRNFPRQLIPSLSKSVQLRNLGIYGQLLSTMDANKANVTGLYDAGKAKNICLVGGGSNDITVSGLAAETVYSSLASYTATLRAAGYKVVWSTLLPRLDSSSGEQSARNNYNQMLRDNQGASADGLVDYAADPTIGPQASASNATYYADGVHPTTAGYAVMAAVAGPVIDGLL